MDRLPDLGSVWRALADSADAMPPLFHIATRASHAAISDEATAARLPGAIGYWVACLSAWIFLRRRTSAASAWRAVGAYAAARSVLLRHRKAGIRDGAWIQRADVALLASLHRARAPAVASARTRHVSVLCGEFPLLRRVLDDFPCRSPNSAAWATLTAGDAIPFP